MHLTRCPARKCALGKARNETSIEDGFNRRTSSRVNTGDNALDPWSSFGRDIDDDEEARKESKAKQVQERT